jgi:hypothetical protein
LFIPHFQGRNDKIHHKEKEKWKVSKYLLKMVGIKFSNYKI